MTNNRAHVYLITLADRGMSAHNSMRHNLSAAADVGMVLNYHIGADLNIIGQTGPGRN
jgi:hypothetical protein